MKYFLSVFVFLLTLNLNAGTITRSSSSLPNFGSVYPFHSSVSQRFTVSGSALAGNLTITAPTGFEVSLNYLHGYTSSLVLTPTSGTVATTNIYARFSPSSTGTFSNTIQLTSSGSTTQTVSVSATCIAWAIPTNYYSTITNQRGAALKTALYSKISTGTTSLSYTPGVWNAFATTDVQPNGKIWDVYSTRFDIASPYEYTLSTDQCGSYSVEGDCYNREHTMPQSWFNSTGVMQTDVHHLMASDGKVNGERSNWPFGNVTTAAYTSLYGGKRGTGTTNFGYTGTVFEPINEYKGDIARAQLYMATRYENLIAGWQFNGNADEVLAGNSFPAYDPWFVSLLISWHNLDPVSDKEIKRNNAIYNLQNNRNPFVDSPQFVQRIWGGTLPAEPTLNSSQLTVTNVSTTSVRLNWVSGNGQRRIVLVRASGAVNALPVDTIHYNANSNTLSAPQIGSGNLVVYNGTGSTVTLTNLTPGTVYHYAVIEYNGWYTSTNYRTSSFLASSSTTLPVSWLSFTAQLTEDKYVQLHWSTASELNNHLFEVQQSEDATNWTVTGEVAGNGTTSALSHYSYNATLPDVCLDKQCTVYYRLKQIDHDGAFAYSEVKYVTLSAFSENTYRVWPNPLTTEVNITASVQQATPVHISLQNINGYTFVNQFNEVSENTPTVNLRVDVLPVGMYILTLIQQNTGEHFRYKLIKN